MLMLVKNIVLIMTEEKPACRAEDGNSMCPGEHWQGWQWGFRELIWSYAYLLLPSTSEITREGPAAAVPMIVDAYLSRAACTAQGL